ncbi:MAG: cyclopropane-fatty-acyl-phospholipid synthase family protein [Candidatus Binatus sp.]|uniref:SAM-dependent methyltransferase n=1 Tax=Candidatus Binatus sp. TaxID=2811406 RepID=UPI00271C46BC|nr:cyclopropane-fatty-acyl-phospholipid synthase family protein [Candidatus Binatus sp.]MDO8433241.1 cyclopropane-fatty-acyl-phospholipid synthase family protein [Candidatus Binatus sp.]
MPKSGSIVASGVDAARRRRPAIIDRFARGAVLARLQGLKRGRLVIEDSELPATRAFGQNADQVGSSAELCATIRVRDPRFYSDLALAGSIGAGEAYMAGSWTTDDLTALVQIMIRNRDVMDAMDSGLARLANPVRKLLHYLNRNTKDGSARNIAAHYDLGNDFFELVLDRSLMYSCAIFERPDATLEEAALAKIDRICRKLDLRPTDHLVEIGTGWGAFAIHAAKNYGCRVTTTTISREQHDYAVKRIADESLQDRITVLLKDYRDLQGQFDKAVSIEMIEAVGHHFVDSYFKKCSELLKPDGTMLLQAITIADQYYASALRNVDFIKKYIFPGSFIPSVTALCDSITRASDMRLFHLEDLTPNYAETLKHWRLNMFRHIDRVRALGYPEEFIRMWEFYLCYCEGGFRERYIGDVQMLLTKPASRRPPILPSL